MVSGLVTSPCDHERILSGDARLMRIASKSDVNELRESKDGLMFPFGVSFQLPASSYQLRRCQFHLPLVAGSGSWQLSYDSARTGSPSGGASGSASFFFVFISSTSRHSAWSSRMRTLNDSGNPGWNEASPLTIAS